jgi:hypothetical protein
VNNKRRKVPHVTEKEKIISTTNLIATYFSESVKILIGSTIGIKYVIIVMYAINDNKIM